MEYTSIITTSYKEEEVISLRNILKERYKKNSLNINSDYIYTITPLDLKILFKLYDEIFLKDFFKLKNLDIKFSVSKRLEKVAGKTIFKQLHKNIMIKEDKNTKIKGEVKTLIKEDYEIRIGIRFFIEFNKYNHNSKVCGITVVDSLEALLLVFEHELCHLLEFYIFKTSSCKKKQFKNISTNLFKHRGIYHELKVV
ncbi:MAG: SprT-like domain-containing protein [Clostridium sp.]